MRYRDLKAERDAAIARAVEAERMSMKGEFDRVTCEFEEEKARLRKQARESETESYWRGFNDGLENAAKAIARLPRAGGGLKSSCYCEPPTKKELEEHIGRLGSVPDPYDVSDELKSELMSAADKSLTQPSPEETFCQKLYESGKRRAELNSFIKNDELAQGTARRVLVGEVCHHSWEADEDGVRCCVHCGVTDERDRT
jgi:hypothetical protein